MPVPVSIVLLILQCFVVVVVVFYGLLKFSCDSRQDSLCCHALVLIKECRV